MTHESTSEKHRERAIELRSDGMTFREIVQELPNNPTTGEPYSPLTAFQWVAQPDREADGA